VRRGKLLTVFRRPNHNSLILLAYALVVLFPEAILAHPMGNFSISHYARIQIDPQAVQLLYIIDMAEVPTFQEMNVIDGNGNGQIETSEKDRYLARKVEDLTWNLSLRLNDRKISLQRMSQTLDLIPGGYNLPTMKITVKYHAEIPQDSSVEAMILDYEDKNFEGRQGWKEIVAKPGEGIEFVEATVPLSDKTNELSLYPEDPAIQSPQNLTASIRFRMGAESVGLSSRKKVSFGKDTPPGTVAPFRENDSKTRTEQQRLVQLLSQSELKTSIILLALIVAFSLGAFHALSPGHGKTVVGAYLVGTRGTAKHAILLGAIVTITHTVGVFILGLITLYASKYVLPEKLYPWLGFGSGLGVVMIGFGLFLQRYRNLCRHSPDGHSHSHVHLHPHDHTHLPHADHEHSHLPHSHGDLVHTHGGATHSHDYSQVKFKDLFTLGVTGGMVPCPSALVVLLSAISINRVGLGLLLILAFSLGLALVLMAIGLMMIYARSFMERFTGEGRILKTLPVFSSLAVTGLGAIIAVQSLINGGILQISISGGR
jgi:nickel/cobalt exporter